MIQALLELFGGIFAFAGHITGGSSFPEPLSPEEEKDCIARLEAGDAEGGFMAAHTLKGIAGNLGFTALYEAVCVLVEFLRAGDLDGARASYAPAEAAYRAVTALLAGGGN